MDCSAAGNTGNVHAAAAFCTLPIRSAWLMRVMCVCDVSDVIRKAVECNLAVERVAGRVRGDQ